MPLYDFRLSGLQIQFKYMSASISSSPIEVTDSWLGLENCGCLIDCVCDCVCDCVYVCMYGVVSCRVVQVALVLLGPMGNIVLFGIFALIGAAVYKVRSPPPCRAGIA